MIKELKKLGFHLIPSFIFIVLFIVGQTTTIHVLPESKWYILCYFLAIQYLGHLLLQRVDKTQPEQLINYFLAWMVIRFITAGLFVAYFIWKNKFELKLFLITFFVFYLCYTFFDLMVLSRNLRRFSKEG